MTCVDYFSVKFVFLIIMFLLITFSILVILLILFFFKMNMIFLFLGSGKLDNYFFIIEKAGRWGLRKDFFHFYGLNFNLQTIQNFLNLSLKTGISGYALFLIIFGFFIYFLGPRKYKFLNLRTLVWFEIIAGCSYITYILNQNFFFNDFLSRNWAPWTYQIESFCFLPYSENISFYSFALICLNFFICLLCNIYLIEVKHKIENISQSLFELYLIRGFVTLAFITSSFFFFYMAFEAVLFVLFLSIGIHSSQPRGVKAAYYFHFYTFCSSLFFLIGILLLERFAAKGVGSHIWSNFLLPEAFWVKIKEDKLNILGLDVETATDLMVYQSLYTSKSQVILFILFIIPMLVKVPLIPLHLWLIEAHVEASTLGSVVLAGVLLKLGPYGIFHFILKTFPAGGVFFQPSLMGICLLSSFIASYMILFETDLKRIVAYSSIAHMSLGLAGLFTFKIEGLLGCFYMLLTHGVVSPALFFLVGMLYERYNSRNINDYSGLVKVMPLFSFFLFIFCVSNFGFPFSGNFISEVNIFASLVFSGFLISFFGGLSFILAPIYSFRLYQRLCTKVLNKNISIGVDLSFGEISILGVLLLSNFFLFFFSIQITKYCMVDFLQILKPYIYFKK